MNELTLEVHSHHTKCSTVYEIQFRLVKED